MEDQDNMNSESTPFSDEPGITIHLEAFEGPLDLLLHLIKKEEIDIWNIPIARITEQYLEYIQIMKDLNINVAGEWLLPHSILASTHDLRTAQDADGQLLRRGRELDILDIA